MGYVLPLLAALLPAVLPYAAAAAEITVSRADLVEPDAELRKTVDALRALSARGEKKHIKKVEAYFAPRVKTFSRSLDPFQPWNPTRDLTGEYLGGMADVIVERGEPQPGEPLPDYRLDAMKVLASLIPENAVFGALPEMPGAICTPAAYRVDRQAASAFARRFQLDAYSLTFFNQDVLLADKPRGKRGEIVPAHALMIFDNDPKAPAGWERYESAGGVKGYMKGRDDALNLSQNHVCFAKVKGKYRITAVFGYGL